MARGNARAPSQNAYRGTIGRTQTRSVHVTSSAGDLVVANVHVAIDAVSDPELVERLYAGTLNAIDGLKIAVPVVYHDPAAEVMVLVLDEVHRHRELDERIAVYERLRDEAAPIPAYAKQFAVVFGADGLRAYLEQRAHEAMGQTELEREKRELSAAKAELERLRSEMRARVIAQVTDKTTVSTPPPKTDEVTNPVPKEEIETSLKQPVLPVSPVSAEPKRPRVEVDEEPTGRAIIPPGSDPLTTETTELAADTDPWLEFAATGTASTFAVKGELVRLALLAGDQIARGLNGNLDVRVLLQRAPTFPVVTLVIGPPAALRVPSPTQLAVLPLDIGLELDRNVLVALAKKFEIQVDVVHRGRPVRRVKLVAPLADNTAFILRAADDHLRGLASDGEVEPSFLRARDLVTGAGYDLLGLEHAEATEFRDEKLAQLDSAQALRRALAIARRFARPSREDYLVCARGFPLERWRQLRRHVLESAVAWGIWMGPELAQVAVSEGLARSRRDLVVKLEAGFEALRAHPTAFDIDEDAAADNAKALADEAKAMGVESRRLSTSRPTNGAIKSEDVPTVSGSIERTPTQSLGRGDSIDDLLAQLDDRAHRVAAASELCDRGEGRAAAAVVAAVKKMSRAEAVRILGKSVKLGTAAAGPLMEGLKSSKAFLRHGCALALALLRTEDGTHAVIDLLLEEPTEIWREIARAIGQIGPTALMPLASRLGRLGDSLTPALGERCSWAMAHVGVRGGKPALEQMAAGTSVVAPIAKQALELLDNAARDEVRVRPGGQPGKDVTVNRQFSRRFFEALEADRPEVAQAALHELEQTSGMEMLDDADIIVEEDEESELDESDLIQT